MIDKLNVGVHSTLINSFHELVMQSTMSTESVRAKNGYEVECKDQDVG